MKPKSITRATILAAAKRKWPGYEFDFRVHHDCPVGEARESLKEKRKANRARHAELTQSLLDSADALDRLVAACEFWRDVDGGEPSTSQLKEATAKARQHIDMRDERRELQTEYDDGYALIARWRYELLSRRLGGFAWSYVAACDTIEEVLQKIEAHTP